MFRLDEEAGTEAIRSVRTDDFMPETAFADSVKLYLFDRKLRDLLADVRRCGKTVS